MKNHTLALHTIVHEELKQRIDEVNVLLEHYNSFGNNHDLEKARQLASDTIDHIRWKLEKTQQHIKKLPMNTLMVNYPVLMEMED